MTRKTAMPIAVIGSSCLVAGAESPAQLWDYLSSGIPRFTEVPSSRFHWKNFYSNNPADTDKGSVWRGSFFKDMELPWREYKIGPKMLDDLHRIELYTVEAVRRALADARLLERPFPRERTAVIMGGSEMGFDFRIVHPYLWHMPQMVEALQQALVKQGLPQETRERILETASQALTGVGHRDITRGSVSGMSLALGRACSLFDLKGPHYVVNSACASVLAALEHAIKGLALGDYDVALVGGTSPYLSPSPFVTFERMQLLTQDAHPRPFDARASGTLLGEGTGFLALRRLDEALKAGDTIQAVIRGIGGANEGRRGALISPPDEAQRRAALRAYAQAGYAPGTVQYLECHANGVEFLEASELSAMAQVYGPRAPGSLTLGSTKNMVGYLQSAAVVPGLMRTLMALKHRQLPAQAHVRQPRAELCAEGTPFRLLSEPLPWEAPAGGLPRRAGINSLAMGGQAYHLTLEEYVPEYHAQLAAEHSRPPVREPVAVVAFGAITPGAQDSDTFFQNVLAKKDQIVRIPKERFHIDRYFDEGGAMGKIYCPLGGFIHDFHFDAKAFRMPPMLAAQLDRTHLYTLTAAAEALSKTSAPQKAPERTAVFMADMPGRSRERQVDLRVGYTEMDAALRQALLAQGLSQEVAGAIAGDTEKTFKKDFEPLTPYTLAGFAGSSEAALISHLYGFKGPTGTFESTCASSLAAIDAGVTSLQLGDADVVLAGGAFADLTPELYTVNCTFQGMSKHGSRPFDAKASGFIPGEGAGVLVLKRLSDAERDGDRILGLIKGVGASSDGKGKSLLAPNPLGQQLAVQRALQRAHVSPTSLQYIACHGTATPVGDFTEVSTYTQVLEGLPPGSVSIGSVKSMIGHLHSAAGVINVVQMLKSLEHKTLPPQINCERPNPDIAWAEIPVQVLTEPKPWPAPAQGGPRRAGISAFGMGGTNYHLILEEYLGAPDAAAHDRSAFPMVDAVLERTAESLVAVRELRLETDRYLDEHRVDGVAVLPGTFGMEMMAEAALLLKPGMHVTGLKDVQFHQAAKAWPGRTTRLVITARLSPSAPPGLVPVDVLVETEVRPRPEVKPMRRKAYTATVLLSPTRVPAPTVEPATAALFTAAGRQDMRQLYNRTEDVTFGPMLQGGRSLRLLSATQLAAWVVQAKTEGLFSFTQAPRLQVAPLALDSLHHAGGLLAYYQHECVVLPGGADELRLHAPLPEGQEICVLSTYQSASDTLARVSLIAFDPATRKVYAEINGIRLLLLKKIGPVLKPLIDGKAGGGRA
ncbi:beta-ketoacyl synthase N-terminal-like domain-containing protein [Stigmatella erecta]|uniref:polyketide synthase family protein n=1 Tax=Stigmatella erecta TaxID=83460 RepID=UPI001FE6BA48|nr:beta-ketoacyl synthase N-terminal-like domain-containing protein [Stigmatella erecta]